MNFDASKDDKGALKNVEKSVFVINFLKFNNQFPNILIIISDEFIKFSDLQMAQIIKKL